MGKKRQRVRWSTVDGLKWAGKEEEDSNGSTGDDGGGRIPGPPDSDVIVPEQLMAPDHDDNISQKPVLLTTHHHPYHQGEGVKHYYDGGGRGGGDYYYYQNYTQMGAPNWGYTNGGGGNWTANDPAVGPRFERRGQSKGRYPGNEEGFLDTEEMPNGFTKIRSKNLDILFKREYYQQKLKPKEQTADCGTYDCPTEPSTETPVDDTQHQPDTADSNIEEATSEERTEQSSTAAKPPKVTKGGSFEHINVSEIAEFKPSSAVKTTAVVTSLPETPECTEPTATYYPPPAYYPTPANTTAVVATTQQIEGSNNYPTATSNTQQAQQNTSGAPTPMSTCASYLPPSAGPAVQTSYLPPSSAPAACADSSVRPNLYLYSPADNTLIPCKGVILTDQGQYYYLANPGASPMSAGGSSNGSDGTCTPMPVGPPPQISYITAPSAAYPQMMTVPPEGSGCEGYPECGSGGSVPYYSSPCLSQCQSSTPQTPNSSGTSTQPASPPLLQSYHPTNWFPSDNKMEIEEEPVQQQITSQKDFKGSDSPTVQYIPGLSVQADTTHLQGHSKKKKKKKKKVVAQQPQGLEHRDSLSSDQEQHILVSSYTRQTGGDESRTVSSPPATGGHQSPVMEVILTDDLADSMVNPPTDPECSDEETLKITSSNNLTTVDDNDMNNDDTNTAANTTLVRDDTFTNLNEIQEILEAVPTLNKEGSSETNEHLTDSGIEDNACNTSSENVQEESQEFEESKEDSNAETLEDVVEASTPTEAMLTEDEVAPAVTEALSTQDEPETKDLMAVKETENESSNNDTTHNDELTVAQTESSIKPVKEILEIKSEDVKESSSISVSLDSKAEPEVVESTPALVSNALSIVNNQQQKSVKESKKKNKKSNNKNKAQDSTQQQTSEDASADPKPVILTAEAKPVNSSADSIPAVSTDSNQPMSYSAACRLREAVPTTTTLESSKTATSEAVSKMEEKSSNNSSKPLTSTKMPNRTSSRDNDSTKSSKTSRVPNQDRQGSTQDRQSSTQGRQSSTQGRQSSTQGRQGSTQGRQGSTQKHPGSTQRSQSSTQDRQVRQGSSGGEWETVPASIAAPQPGEWERKQGKKNRKIFIDDSQFEADDSLEYSELPSLETVHQPLPAVTKVEQQITVDPTSPRDATPTETEAPAAKTAQASEKAEKSKKKKAKDAKKNSAKKETEKTVAFKKEASPIPDKEESESSEEDLKAGGKKKKKKNVAAAQEPQENPHKVVICDNQIEVRFSRSIRRASEVMDCERLEAVKRSGYCDVLLVEKLGFGIFRGSMHLNRLHQGKYVPPERADAELPEPLEDATGDQEEDSNPQEGDQDTTETEQGTDLPTLAEEIDLD